MKVNNEQANRLIKLIVPYICKNPVDPKAENKVGVLTPINLIPEEKKELLSVLLG